MENFTQYMPTKVVFGKGTERETGKLVRELGASRVLLIYGGGSVVKSGLLGRIKENWTKKRSVILSFPEFSPIRG